MGSNLKVVTLLNIIEVVNYFVDTRGFTIKKSIKLTLLNISRHYKNFLKEQQN